MNRCRRAAALAIGSAALLASPIADVRAAQGATVLAIPASQTVGYATSNVTSPRGATAVITNLDPLALHDVVSKATKRVKVGTRTVSRPLFRSKLAAAGETAPVTGTETLKPGTYQFFCSLHPGMVGLLRIS